ncbi:recombinase family protein [Streptococcus infantis]
MLEDCRQGKIDLILVKSISRFARNQLDFISIYRELKALPHPVGIL